MRVTLDAMRSNVLHRSLHVVKSVMPLDHIEPDDSKKPSRHDAAQIIVNTRLACGHLGNSLFDDRVALVIAQYLLRGLVKVACALSGMPWQVRELF